MRTLIVATLLIACGDTETKTTTTDFVETETTTETTQTTETTESQETPVDVVDEEIRRLENEGKTVTLENRSTTETE
jgi:hypothetical protein